MNEITNELMKYLLPLALGVATAVGGVFIAYLNKKKAQIIASTDNVVAKKYIDMVGDTVIDCVEAINQTYVDALKKDNAFTKKHKKLLLSNVMIKYYHYYHRMLLNILMLHLAILKHILKPKLNLLLRQ